MAKKVTLEVIKRCHKWPVLNVLKVANMPWHTAHTNNPKKKKQITGFTSIFFPYRAMNCSHFRRYIIVIYNSVIEIFSSQYFRLIHSIVRKTLFFLLIHKLRCKISFSNSDCNRTN